MTSDQIQARVIELARAMQGVKPILLVPILNGGMMFAADLLRALPQDADLAPMVVDGRGVQYAPNLTDRRNREIWVVDNTICSGFTLREALAVLPPGTKSLVMFGLPAKRSILPTLLGMEVGTKFVAGYGADHRGGMRGRRDLYDVKEKKMKYLPPAYVDVLEKRHGKGLRELLKAKAIPGKPGIHVENLSVLLKQWDQRKSTFGLGDLVATVANPIARALNKVVGTNLGSDQEGCGCRKRKDALNRLMPDITHPLRGEGILPPGG